MVIQIQQKSIMVVLGQQEEIYQQVVIQMLRLDHKHLLRVWVEQNLDLLLLLQKLNIMMEHLGQKEQQLHILKKVLLLAEFKQVL